MGVLWSVQGLLQLLIGMCTRSGRLLMRFKGASFHGFCLDPATTTLLGICEKGLKGQSHAWM